MTSGTPAVLLPPRPADIVVDHLIALFAGAMTFVYLADIPKLGGLPVSPKYLFIALSLGLMLVHRRGLVLNGLRSLPRPFYLFFMFSFAVGAAAGSKRGVVAPLETLAVFTVIAGLMSAGRARAVRFTRLLSGLLLASSLWMMCSILIGEPFMSVRRFLYSAQVDNFQLGYLTMEHPTGFTFNHFIMGYQVAAGFILAGMLSLAGAGSTRRGLFRAACAMTMVAAVVFAAQRSVVVAVAAAVSVFIIRRKYFKTLLFVVAAVLVSLSLVKYAQESDLQDKTVYGHYQRTKDSGERLGWQFAAAKTVLQHPLGNIGGGLDWEQKAIENGADFTFYEGNVMAVHNSYLGVMLRYGWAGAVLVIACLWALYRGRYLAAWRGSGQATGGEGAYQEAVALAFVAVSVQALFHNASVFTYEPASWAVLAMLCAWSGLGERRGDEHRA